MLRCSRCILPENYPKIEFDPEGECNYCKKWQNKWGTSDFSVKENQLDIILGRFRSQTKPYDCVVGMSGGKDSSYVAYLLKQKGMTPLAVTFDNGFMTELSRENIRKVVDSLSLGHVVISFGHEYITSLYRNFLLAAGEFCSVCNVGIRAALFRAARLYHINLIVSGRSRRTEANSPPEFFSCSPGYFNNVAQSFSAKEEILGYLYFQQWRRIWWQLRKKPFYMELPSVLPWDEKQMMAELEQHIGWSGTFGKQHEDCKMSDAKELLKYRKFGVTEMTAKLSSLVRDGQLTREDAIHRAEKNIADLEDHATDIQELLREVFSLSAAELTQAFQRSHQPFLSGSDRFVAKIKKIYENR